MAVTVDAGQAGALSVLFQKLQLVGSAYTRGHALEVWLRAAPSQ
jgi:hypothetical protein